MWSRKRRCCSSETGAWPSGTSNAPTSRISSTQPQPLRPRPPATPTIAWSMQDGRAARTPARHNTSGRGSTSPVTRMIQSSSACRCLTTNGSPSISARSMSAPDLPSDAIRGSMLVAAPSSASNDTTAGASPRVAIAPWWPMCLAWAMPLDPQARVLLDQLAAAGDRRLADMTVAEARQTFVLMAALAAPGPDLDEVRDESADGVPVRVYRPAAERPLPGIVYFHGGGFVIGDLATHDATCRDLALRTGMVIVSVDYRLAPEQVFPAAADDAATATRWVHDHAGELGVDVTRIAVAGDSAGGNLAAVATLDARERGGPR